ncbi:MAG: SDR family oxidoreductase [Pirellulales bacterium]
MQIQDHTFLITGGASGLGAACAARLTADNANVVIADIDPQSGTALAEACRDRARFVLTDVTDTESIQAAVNTAVDEFGGLHGVVTCAGVLNAARVLGRKEPHPMEIFRRVVDVNLVGSFDTVRLAAEAIAKSEPEEDNERGVIVMTSSVAAWDGQIGQAAYAASKGAVASMTLPIARELGRFGIRVAAIAPGVFATSMMGAVTDELRESLESQVPFPKRFGQPEEFANLVAHVIENRMVNGTVLRLDGGLRMGPT